MTLKPEDIERMAREAGVHIGPAPHAFPLGDYCSRDVLARFAALAYARGVEDAARVCDKRRAENWGVTECEAEAGDCAEAIRALLKP